MYAISVQVTYSNNTCYHMSSLCATTDIQNAVIVARKLVELCDIEWRKRDAMNVLIKSTGTIYVSNHTADMEGIQFQQSYHEVYTLEKIE